MEFDWQPEQVLLLTRTLDALPAHLVTPFHGPIPPNNLLDKIARGVSQAKGPTDWPHSVRATRVKLLELARAKAKEEAAAERDRRIIEEEAELEESSYSYFLDGEEKPVAAPKRPLYRQSSMDFIKPGPDEIKENASIARLSSRLQRTDRLFPNPAFHPYSRRPQGTRRSSSPPLPTDLPALTNNSSTSSSSFSSWSSATAPRVLRRSASNLSVSSIYSASSGSLPDPRIQRVRRSDSLCSGPPPLPLKDMFTPTLGIKRAPSYGALAQEARLEHAAAVQGSAHARKLSAGSYPSSDEEEKARTKRAKKIKTKAGQVPSTPSATDSPPVSPVPTSPAVTTAPNSPVALRTPSKVRPRLKGVQAEVEKSPKSGVTPKRVSSSSNKPASAVKTKETGKTVKSSKIVPASTTTSTTTSTTPTRTTRTKTPSSTHRPVPMNLQRNPSMFGAELPNIQELSSGSAGTSTGSGSGWTASGSSAFGSREHGSSNTSSHTRPSLYSRSLYGLSSTTSFEIEKEVEKKEGPTTRSAAKGKTSATASTSTSRTTRTRSSTTPAPVPPLVLSESNLSAFEQRERERESSRRRRVLSGTSDGDMMVVTPVSPSPTHPPAFVLPMAERRRHRTHLSTSTASTSDYGVIQSGEGTGALSPGLSTPPLSPAPSSVNNTPASASRLRTLRRVRRLPPSGTGLGGAGGASVPGTRAPGRRISFGSLAVPEEDVYREGGVGGAGGLEGAFQLS